jgi:hypothetical protein
MLKIHLMIGIRLHRRTTRGRLQVGYPFAGNRNLALIPNAYFLLGMASTKELVLLTSLGGQIQWVL